MDLALTLDQPAGRRAIGPRPAGWVGGRYPRVRRNHAGSISCSKSARRRGSAIGRGGPAPRDLSPTGMQMIPSLGPLRNPRGYVDAGTVLRHSASERVAGSSSGGGILDCWRQRDAGEVSARTARCDAGSVLPEREILQQKSKSFRPQMILFSSFDVNILDANCSDSGSLIIKRNNSNN